MIAMKGRDKGILTNAVVPKEHIIEVMRNLLRDIYDMERGSAEVGLKQDLKPMKFGILT